MASRFEEEKLRTFETGATRDQNETKPDYTGFLSPLVIAEFGRYMNRHRVQPDGTLRAANNWKLGIPFDAYLESGWRHYLDWWTIHQYPDNMSIDDLKETLCAMLFNVQGYLHELLKKENTPTVGQRSS